MLEVKKRRTVQAAQHIDYHGSRKSEMRDVGQYPAIFCAHSRPFIAEPVCRLAPVFRYRSPHTSWLS